MGLGRYGVWIGWGALLVALVLLLLPGQAALPVIDRDEALFVQSSRQMVEDGALVDIRFQTEPRYKKPVGIYWLQGLAARLSGAGAEAPLWVWRLPSLIGAIAAIGLTAVLGATLFGPQAGVAGAAIFGAAFVLAGEARIAKTDAVLLALVLVMLVVLARLARAGRGWQGRTGQGGRAEAPGRWAPWAFWLACGGAILIKGPIGPLAVALAALGHGALRRDLRWLRPLWAPLPILAGAALVLPWLLGITLVGGAAFWREAVRGDLLSKVAAGQEGKGAPPGTYLALLWFAFWPGAALVPLALVSLWRRRAEARVTFALAAIVPLWLVFEAVPTKLFHYTMPTYPALAILVAAGILGLRQAPGLGARVAVAVALATMPAVAVVLAAFQFRWGTPPGAVALVAGAVVVALGAAAVGLAMLARGRGAAAIAALALGGAVFNAALLSGLARTPYLWPTERAAAAAAQLVAARGCARPSLIGWGYEEPSVVWVGGRATPRLPADAPLPAAVAADPCAVVLRAVGDAPAEVPGWQVGARVEGLAIGAGRVVRLDLLQPVAP
ncbi:MAG: ArnT family glycosyltransferase [Gemmobacter sp.]